MITTVTLNPCMDLTLELSGLTVGQLNMIERARTDVAGKGVNVSTVLRAFGLATMCTGISFDGNGQKLADFLDERSIAHDFVMAHGDIRTNMKVLDKANNVMTEINSRGEEVSPAILRELMSKLADCAKQSSIMVFSGRIPNGAGDDIYRECVRAVADYPVKVIVDAEKEPLRLAIEAKPYLIKPNTFELEHTFGCKINSKQDVVEASRSVIAQGVEIVCVSMGGDGAMIVDANEAWFAPVLDIEVKGYQGAGDSVVAGVCKAIHEGLGLEGMLSYGVAAASASLIREGTLLCQKPDFERLLKQVKLERV